MARRIFSREFKVEAVRLVRPWASATSRQAVQAFQRSKVCRQTARCRRLYVDPPVHVIVLSVDEKSQIQALDRTQPGPAAEKGPRRNHDS